MKFSKSPEWLVKLFDGLLEATDASGDRKQMFGCPCAFTRGQMYAGLFGEQLFVRLRAEDRERLITDEGATSFDPMGGRPMREYVVLPEAWVDDEERLAQWVGKARAYASTLPPKKKRAPARKKKPAERR